MRKLLRLLIVEDSEDDTLLLMRELRKGGFEPDYQRVDTAAAMMEALAGQSWDLIISDNAMPQFDAMSALEIAKESDPDLPFIIVSGRIGEAVAVAAMRAGASDYIMKANLNRLCPAIERELQDAEVRRERRSAEEALHQAQKMESLGLMAGGVAHDFSNLLVAIKGQCGIAISQLPEESQARVHLNKVIKATEKAADLTRQMLDFAGGGQFELRPIELNQLLRDSASLLDVVLPGSVELTLDLASELPSIMGDGNQIQQILMNLTLNGADAIGSKSGDLAIVTGLLPGNGRRVYKGWYRALDARSTRAHVFLEIRDNGSGMDRARAAKIFDPFYTTKGKGRGLGLAAVLGIVRGHGGGLWVKSRPGRGTAFRVLFPALERDLSDDPEPVVESALDNRLVLVIDDELPVREAVADILEMHGLRVLSAAGGNEGLAMFREASGEVELVILDLTMPEMSGEETLHKLQAVDAATPVLLASGYGLSEAKSLAASGHHVGFLQKPFGAAQLLKAVGEALHSTND